MTTDIQNQILQRVRRTIATYQMIAPGDRVVVAVSGGADSVCLADVLYRMREELQVALIVAHFDHGLRPREDAAETRFVQALAADKGLAFETQQGRLSNQDAGASLEDRARQARYAFLEMVKEKHQAQKIAVGHTLDDQAETVIMRFLRGSGAKGLAGIPPKRGAIIRPLLEVEGAEIRAYLSQQGQGFMTDSSNLQEHFLRNKIRLDLMPRLLEYQPRLVTRLGHLARLFQEEAAYLAQQAQTWVQSHIAPVRGRPLALLLDSFLTQAPILQKYIAREMIGRVKKDLRRIDFGHIQSILDLARSRAKGSELHLPNQVMVKKRYGRLLFLHQPAAFAPFSFSIPGPGPFRFAELEKDISLSETEGSELRPHDAGQTALLDAGKISYPLTVRNFRPGDRFMPLGMRAEKKIKEFFIDQKVPREMRARIPLYFSGNQVVWVGGYRIDERFKVTAETKRILEINMKAPI